MNIFYEESGQFKVALVIQKNESTYQVDTSSGKRAKIRTAQVFFEFEGDAKTFLPEAQKLAADIDVDLLWETCPDAEFTAPFAAEEYFGHAPSFLETAALLMALYGAPAYFYKKGKGVFKAAPEDILKQALAALERKREQEALVEAWTEELKAFRLPESVGRAFPELLMAPDKQSLPYKAFEAARTQLKMDALAFCLRLGVFASVPEYLQKIFEHQYFRRGTDFSPLPAPEIIPLPQAAVKAFSIDDADTTEIDDALSVQYLDDVTRVGIHIALPALALTPNGAAEKTVFERMSTVYFPGGKITMLPENWIQAFSLDAGGFRPALSLYVDVNKEFDIVDATTRMEAVWIDANLRLQEIEPLFNHEQGAQLAQDAPEAFAHQRALAWLYEAALNWKKKRVPNEIAHSQKDYFIVLNEGRVDIGARERNSPLDTLVSECMILANSRWAQMLHEAQVAGVFRVQTVGKVRLSLHSEPHTGLGLQHYGWFTSPLRRASDMLNQRQLLHVLDPNIALRFESQAIELMGVMREFEQRYSAYADFQREMEQYWTLVYLQQNNIEEVTGIVTREDWVRLEALPMSARASGVPVCAPRSRVRLKVAAIDTHLRTLSLNFLRFEHEAA